MVPEAAEPMIPLHDDNPTRRFGWLTLALILGNTAVFAVEITMPADALARLIDTWAFVPARLTDPTTAPMALVTIVSAAFLHAGWLHLGGNMLYLWIFGNNIEDRLGPIRFGLFYLACAAGAAIGQTLASPESTAPMVGASGAIAGVLGAYLVLFPRARIVTLIPILFYLELAALPAAFVIGFWFVIQIAQGLTALGGTLESGVAWWAHIGGFATGILLVAPLGLRSLLPERGRRRNHSRR